MKRIIAILLTVTMVFAMVACGGKPIDDNINTGGANTGGTSGGTSGGTNSGTSGGTNGNTSGGSNSGSSGGTTTKLPDPVYNMEGDRLVYEATVNENGTWNYLNEFLQAPTFTPYYNGYKAALSMTFDDGYNYQAGYTVSEIFAKYGFSGTEMMSVCFVNKQNIIDEWNKIIALGYIDVGCHGWDHANPVGMSESNFEHEIKDAIMFLREKFPTQNVLTYASPFAQPNSAYENYMSDYVLVNRLEAMGTQAYLGQGEYNPYRLKAVSVNGNNPPLNEKGIRNYVDAGAWIVELYHEVEDGASGINCPTSTFSAHCKMLYESFGDELWVASFEKVAIYSKQIENTFVEYVDADYESITIKAGCTIADDVFNIPMTVKVNVPSFVNSAYIERDGKIEVLDVTKELNKNYVLVKNIAASGEEVKIYLGGNKNCDNGCDHIYVVKEQVAPTCTSIGYSINVCVKCGKGYNGYFKAPYEHKFLGNPIDCLEPTADNEGYLIFKCRDCDATKKEILERLTPKE